METLRNYLLKDGWKRDYLQTKDDISKLVSSIDFKTLESEAGKITTGGAIMGLGGALIVLGTLGELYSLQKHNMQDLIAAYQAQKYGTISAVAGIGLVAINGIIKLLEERVGRRK